jgi:hypothetical protein
LRNIVPPPDEPRSKKNAEAGERRLTPQNNSLSLLETFLCFTLSVRRPNQLLKSKTKAPGEFRIAKYQLVLTDLAALKNKFQL